MYSTMEVTIRCEKCGKVLKGEAEKPGSFGRCPRCHAKVAIPNPSLRNFRKYERQIVGENVFVPAVPDSLTRSEQAPFVKVRYTEVPPVDFALGRPNHIPLLDLSEGGMGILMKDDESSKELNPGDVFVAEIDFPILVRPIRLEVEVRWIRAIKKERLRHVGVQFCHPDQVLKKVIHSLIKYITSRSETNGFEKWGAFG
jgi:hypothetical protein